MTDAEYWEKKAKRYAELTHTKEFANAYDKAIKLAKIEGKETRCILDISCGNGALLARAITKAKIKWVVGVDHSKAMLDMAKKNLEGAGACTSPKPIEAYKKLASLLTEKITDRKKLMEEYQQAYNTYLSLNKEVAGRTKAVLLQQDRNKLFFEVKPVADVVFFTFPAIGNMRTKTQTPLHVQDLITHIAFFADASYNLCNALEYLREGGTLIAILPVAHKGGEQHEFNKAVLKNIEKAGCEIDTCEIEQNAETGKLLLKLDGYQGFKADIIWVAFRRKKDNQTSKTIRAGLKEVASKILDFLIQCRISGNALLEEYENGKWRIHLKGEQLDPEHAIEQIRKLLNAN